jgi:hypothetical protein
MCLKFAGVTHLLTLLRSDKRHTEEMIFCRSKVLGHIYFEGTMRAVSQ